MMLMHDSRNSEINKVGGDFFLKILFHYDQRLLKSPGRWKAHVHGLVAGRQTVLQRSDGIPREYPASGAVAVGLVVLAEKPFLGAIKDIIVVAVVGKHVVKEDVHEILVDKDHIVVNEHAVDFLALIEGRKVDLLDNVLARSSEVKVSSPTRDLGPRG